MTYGCNAVAWEIGVYCETAYRRRGVGVALPAEGDWRAGRNVVKRRQSLSLKSVKKKGRATGDREEIEEIWRRRNGERRAVANGGWAAAAYRQRGD